MNRTVSFENELVPLNDHITPARKYCYSCLLVGSFVSLYTFKHKLKTHLFTLCLNDALPVFMYFTNFCNALPGRCAYGGHNNRYRLTYFMAEYLENGDRDSITMEHL